MGSKHGFYRPHLGRGFPYAAVNSGAATATPATAPDAYTVGQWAVADNGAGNSVTITVSAVPSLNGNTQTGTQYRIDGGAWQDTALVGLGDIVIVDGTNLPNGAAADIEIRVLVSEYDWDVDGTGDEDSVSDTKTATPTLVVPGLTYAFAGWITNDGIGGDTATASLDLGAAAADRFVLVGIMDDSNPTLVAAPLSLPEIVDEESWGRRSFYGDFVTTGSGSTSMTVEMGANATIWCPVFVIRGSTSLVVKAFEVGNPGTVPVEEGDLVIAIELFDTSSPETWTNSPTEAAETPTYTGSSAGFHNGYAAVFRATADNAAFSPGMASGRGNRIALIVLGEPA